MDLDFEEVRRQYRAEALQACKAAEQRGYDRAVAEHAEMCSRLRNDISRVAEECCQWKELAESVKTVDFDKGKAAALLKYSMEQVYRCLKHEFESDSCAIELTPRFKKALRQATNITSAQIKNIAMSVTGPIDIPSLRAPAGRVTRPPNITLSNGAQPLPVNFSCSIDNYAAKNSSSMFGSKYISYALSTDVTTISDNGEYANLSVNRRYSDFAAFESKLRRILSRCILPVLPPKEVSRQTTDENVVRRRLRYLHAWLRYVAQHFNMSQLKCFGEFVCDDLTDTSWASLLLETVDEKEMVVHSENDRFRSRNTLLLIKRDFRQLSHHMGDALMASKRVNMAIYEYQSALQSVQRSLREVVDMEDTDEEKNNLNAVHDSVKIVEELYHNFGGCMRNLTDSLRFFGQPCMESAQSLIDRCGAHDPMSDSSVEIIAAMAQEWTFFREHRQCELQTYVVECGTRMREESKLTKNRLRDKSLKVSEGGQPDMVEALSNSMYTQSLIFEDLYQKLNDRVFALVRKDSSVCAALTHNERVAFPSGLRRQPVKILDSIKPELSATVEEVNVDCHRDLGRDNEEIETSQGETANGFDPALDNDQQNRIVTSCSDTSQKQRNRRTMTASSSVGAQSTHLRHRQHAAVPRKSVPGLPTVSGASCSDGSNFIATSYGKRSLPACQTPGNGRSLGDASRGHLVTHTRAVSPNRARPSEAYSWGDQSSQNSTAQPSTRTTFVSNIGAATPGDDIGKKTNEAHSDSEDVFQAPDKTCDTMTGWEEVKLPDAEGGGVYYYHRKTRVSRWDRPDESVAAAMESRLHEEEQRVERAVQKRKEEREMNAKTQNERVVAYERIQAQIESVITKWRKPPGAVRERNIVELLKSIGDVVALISGDKFVNSSSIRDLDFKNSSGEEIRRCYMKVVRLIHPDKISAPTSNEERFVAEAAFVVLTEAYQKYAEDVVK